MSVRNGIKLVIGPGLTALIHLARQAASAQFGCAGSERLLLRVSLVPFFAMSIQDVGRLEGDIAGSIAPGMPDGSMSFCMSRSEMSCDDSTGSVTMLLRLHGSDLMSIFNDSQPKKNKRSAFGIGRRGQDAAVAGAPTSGSAAQALTIGLNPPPGDQSDCAGLPVQARACPYWSTADSRGGSDLRDAAAYVAGAPTSFEAAIDTRP